MPGEFPFCFCCLLGRVGTLHITRSRVSSVREENGFDVERVPLSSCRQTVPLVAGNVWGQFSWDIPSHSAEKKAALLLGLIPKQKKPSPGKGSFALTA